MGVTNPALAQTLNDPRLEAEVVATGLLNPTTMAFVAPGDLLVLQKDNGQVRRILDGVLQPAPVLDVAVHFSSERGRSGFGSIPISPTTGSFNFTTPKDPRDLTPAGSP